MRCIFFFGLLLLSVVVPAMAGSFEDSRDGKTYGTIQIGNQVWMSENLNFKARNSRCYDDNPANCEIAGRLYTFDVAINACPSGWKLPEDSDYEELKLFAESKVGKGNAATFLRGKSFDFYAGDWAAKNYKFWGETTFLWSATEVDDSRAYDWVLSQTSDDFVQGNVKFALKKNAFSVRCLKARNSNTASSKFSTIRDLRDGKTYKTVKIGRQTWMAENLDFKTRSSKCKDNKPQNCKKFGQQYTWYEAQRACPAGWHLPTKEEWDILWEYVDGDPSKLVSEKDMIIKTNLHHISAYYFCEEECGSSRRCMDQCVERQEGKERIRPSNSTGFSAYITTIGGGSDAEDTWTESAFAYWNSTDINPENQEEYDEGSPLCIGNSEPLLFHSSGLGEADCRPFIEEDKKMYYPVRCIKD